MILPVQRVHLSFSPGPFRMAMGLVARDPDEMIELDERYPAEAAERRALLEGRHEVVFAAMPGSEAARRAVLDRVADILPRRYPAFFARDGAMLHNRITGEAWDIENPALDPLEVAGRLVQEDLCLMQPSPEGPVLAAAVLCYPSRWSLVEKLGKPMLAIHAPVPFYGERLGRPVDRFFGALAEGKLVERLNWSIVDDPALHQPKGHGRRALNTAITPENAGATLFLKVERQTLSRIGPDGTVLFTIRVHCYPLARVATTPQIAVDLADAVAALPEELALYKSILPFREALLAWLLSRR
jgi:hypothetical protein